MKSSTSRHVLGAILRDVSRSFYVSIRFLPRRLREPIKLAYLLARATDTLADTANIPVEMRMAALRTLASAIQGTAAPNEVVDLTKPFSSLQTNESEKKLIEFLPECFQLLALTNAADLGDIRELLAKITRGQMLDLERFGDSGSTNALGTAADLREYTYLVAGCVGEFWTHLGFRYIADFTKESEIEMMKLAKRYGSGLQLVNIVRDAHVDLAGGRCYFPLEELNAVNLSPEQILQQPERFEPIHRKWIDEADGGLEAGMRYVRSIDHFRVRGATALPALIGARTLSMLRGAGPAAFRQKIKVPRGEVRGMIGWVALTLASRESLDEMFQRYRK